MLFRSPVMFVLLFVYVFGGEIRIPGIAYVDYLMPGIFVQTVVFGSTQTGVGLAIGYVLGTKAGRERYEQLSQSARRLAENPSMQRLQEEVGSLFAASRSRASTTIEGKVTQVADRTADKVATARETATGTTARKSRSSSSSSTAPTSSGSGL